MSQVYISVDKYIEEVVTESSKFRKMNTEEEIKNIKNFILTTTNISLTEEVNDSVKEIIFLAFEEDYIHHYEPIKLKGDN